jgi:competence protein ComEC
MVEMKIGCHQSLEPEGMSMSKKRNTKTILVILLILLSCAMATAALLDPFRIRDPSVSSSDKASSVSSHSSGGAVSTDSEAGLLRVYYFDVGQADAMLLLLPNGTSIGIDAGESATQESLVKWMKEAGVTKLDALVMTHPHADHIGGMQYLIEHLPVGRIYMTEASSTTKTFENLLAAIANQKIQVVRAGSGGSIALDPEVTVDILSPVTLSEENKNDNSIVIRMTYRHTAFLFMGDAESQAEQALLTGKTNLGADILKVGHHGSSSSTAKSFLSKVTPRFAVISVGADNDYNHPSQEVLDRLTAIGAQIFRTDKQGTVVIFSDGQKVTVQSD